MLKRLAAILFVLLSLSVSGCITDAPAAAPANPSSAKPAKKAPPPSSVDMGRRN